MALKYSDEETVFLERGEVDPDQREGKPTAEVTRGQQGRPLLDQQEHRVEGRRHHPRQEVQHGLLLNMFYRRLVYGVNLRLPLYQDGAVHP